MCHVWRTPSSTATGCGTLERLARAWPPQVEAHGGLEKISAEQLAELKAGTPFRGLERELGTLKKDVAANAVRARTRATRVRA